MVPGIKIKFQQGCSWGIVPSLVCMIVCGLFSCKPDMPDNGNAGRIILQPVQYLDLNDEADNFDYYYCLFEANVAGSQENVSDFDYKLIRKANKPLSKKELDTLSFQFQNYEIEKKLYKLVILATPSVQNETRLACESGILDNGSPLSDVCIELVPDGKSGYHLLSKDNYYTIQPFSGKDIVYNNILTIEPVLKRAVGQLVFDIFKVTNNSISQPVATDDGFGSVLDRIEKIRVKTRNFSYRYSISKHTTTTAPKEKEVSITGATDLDDEYLLHAEVQPKEVITGPVTKNNKQIGGSVRVYGPYLLPSPETSPVNVMLSFSYYDTSPVNETYELIGLDNGLQLNLPSGNKNRIYVEKNCYTVTNIGIPHNRVIDLDIFGNVTIETKWD